MLKIYIYSYDGTPITVARKLLEFGCEKRLSDVGQCIFTLSTDDKIIAPNVLQYGNRISAYYQDALIWTGYITQIQATVSQIQFNAVDDIGRSEYRIFRTKQTHSNLSSLVQGAFNALHGIHPLPFSMTTQNNTTINYEIKEGSKLIDMIKGLAKHRIYCTAYDGGLSFGSDVGRTLDGVRKYSSNNRNESNIVSWSRSSNIKNYYNTQISKKNNALAVQSDAAAVGAFTMIEKFSYSPESGDQQTQVSQDRKPFIKIDTNEEEWWTLRVGDRKAVTLYIGGRDPLIDTTGIITKLRVRAKGGVMDVDAQISDGQPDAPRGIHILKKMAEDIQILQTHI